MKELNGRQKQREGNGFLHASILIQRACPRLPNDGEPGAGRFHDLRRSAKTVRDCSVERSVDHRVFGLVEDIHRERDRICRVGFCGLCPAFSPVHVPLGFTLLDLRVCNRKTLVDPKLNIGPSRADVRLGLGSRGLQLLSSGFDVRLELIMAALQFRLILLAGCSSGIFDFLGALG